MPLIKCPECSTEVSDRAESCIKCGCPIKSLVKCPECGTYAHGDKATCAKCGCPLKEKAILSFEVAAPPPPVPQVVRPAPAPVPQTHYSPYSVGSDLDEFETRQATDACAWLLAFTPIIGGVCGAIYGVITYNDPPRWLIMGLYIGLWGADVQILKKGGYTLGAWRWWGLLFYPIYLTLRASKINHKNGYATAGWVITFLWLLIIVLITSGL